MKSFGRCSLLQLDDWVSAVRSKQAGDCHSWESLARMKLDSGQHRSPSDFVFGWDERFAAAVGDGQVVGYLLIVAAAKHWLGLDNRMLAVSVEEVIGDDQQVVIVGRLESGWQRRLFAGG